MGIILKLAKFIILFLFIVGSSYFIGHAYPTIEQPHEVQGFTSIISAQAESRKHNLIKDTEIMKLILPLDRDK